MKLSHLAREQIAEVIGFDGNERERARLRALGVVPRARVHIFKRLKKTVVFGTNDTKVALSMSIADRISVIPVREDVS